jgi:hypothetical protein
MKYDEDLMVELIATGDLTHAKIAEQLSVSRHTVWRIANGLSRPDLQRKIADTVEGMRQATIRFAARRMEKLLEKQMEVALGDGEIARKSREFLIKTFMVTIPAQADKVAAKPPPPRPVDPDKKLDPLTLGKNLLGLSPNLKKQVVEEICGPLEHGHQGADAPETKDSEEAGAQAEVPMNIGKPAKEPEPTPAKKAAEEEEEKDVTKKKKRPVVPPFENMVKGPDGNYIYKISLKLAHEARVEADAEEERKRQWNMKRRTPKPM